jgi:hypothetical protein
MLLARNLFLSTTLIGSPIHIGLFTMGIFIAHEVESRRRKNFPQFSLVGVLEKRHPDLC